MPVRALVQPLLALVVLVPALAAADDDGWETILDATSFKMWKMAPADAADVVVESDGRKEMRRGDGSAHGSWTFADGVLTGEGDPSHLFSPHGDYADFAFQATISISDGGNSGMYFRAKFGSGWPDGYEAQINATAGDPQKSGSLYNIVKVEKAPVGPDTWYTQRVDAVGDHLVITINDAVVVDTHDAKRSVGHVAFQQHNLGSVVKIRDVRIKRIAPAAEPTATPEK